MESGDEGTSSFQLGLGHKLTQSGPTASTGTIRNGDRLVILNVT